MTTKQQIFQPSVESVLQDLKESFKQPEYADPQTKWTGRYKRLLSGNKFEIKDQIPFQRAHLFTGGDAAFTTDESFSYPNKNVLCTSLAIAYATGVHSIGHLNLYGYTTGGPQVFRYRVFGSTSATDKIWVFDPPLRLKDGYIWSYSDGPIGGSEWISIWMNCWYEEK